MLIADGNYQHNSENDHNRFFFQTFCIYYCFLFRVIIVII